MSVTMSNKELIKETTRKRNISRINSNMIDSYENIIDNAINGNGSKGDMQKMVKKYVGMITPSIVATFEKNYMVEPSVNNKLRTDRMVNNVLKGYEEKIGLITSNAFVLANDLSVNSKLYNELRSGGSSIIESLSIASNGKYNVNFSPVSEKLFENSINNYQKQIEAKADFEYNSSLTDNNGDILYTMKTWIWSGLENTRHMGMDSTTIPIDEAFVVINEVTGDEDFMMYPRDDSGSPSNTYNCECEVTYGNEFIM